MNQLVETQARKRASTDESELSWLGLQTCLEESRLILCRRVRRVDLAVQSGSDHCLFLQRATHSHRLEPCRTQSYRVHQAVSAASRDEQRDRLRALAGATKVFRKSFGTTMEARCPLRQL